MEAKSDNIETLAIDCRYSKRLIDKLLSKNSKSQTKVDCDKISKALYIACKYHNNQRRATRRAVLFSFVRSSIYSS